MIGGGREFHPVGAVLDLLPAGHGAVLQSFGFAQLFIPPIGGAVIGNAVNMADPHVVDHGLCADAAAEVGVYAIQRLGQLDKGGAGTADRTQFLRHLRGVGEHRHDAGDTPLSLRFKVHVRLVQPHLGTGAVIVADHHRQRPVGRALFQVIQTGQHVQIPAGRRRFVGCGVSEPEPAVPWAEDEPAGALTSAGPLLQPAAASIRAAAAAAIHFFVCIC